MQIYQGFHKYFFCKKFITENNEYREQVSQFYWLQNLGKSLSLFESQLFIHNVQKKIYTLNLMEIKWKMNVPGT